MKPKYHILLGTIFLIVFYFIFPETTTLNLIILWFSSWLIIDMDVVPYILLKAKTLNPKRFFEYYNKRKKKWENLKTKRKNYKYPIRIFHNLEFLIILFLLAAKIPEVYYAIIGFSFHLICDWLHLIKIKENVLNKVSLVYTIITNKNKRELKI